MTRQSQKRLSTAYDVARLAGVSQSTVSRAFTAGARVSPDTLVKVTAAAEALGYRPNFIARSLITRRSNIVGLAMAHMDNEFYAMLLCALNESFARVGRRLLLFAGNPRGESDPMLSEILKYQVDAIILASTTLSSSLAQDCHRAGIPVVLINRAAAADGVSAITGDNIIGAQVIADFLVRGGHRRLAFVAGLENSSTSHEREEAFTQRVMSHGMEHPMRAVGHYRADATRDAVRQLLSAAERPDGIFCANDFMAFAAIEIARFEFGLDVGKDISIIGFDDVAAAALPSWSLTTYSQPVEAMAQAAVGIIEAGEMAARTQRVLGRLEVRGSARTALID